MPSTTKINCLALQKVQLHATSCIYVIKNVQLPDNKGNFVKNFDGMRLIRFPLRSHFSTTVSFSIKYAASGIFISSHFDKSGKKDKDSFFKTNASVSSRSNLTWFITREFKIIIDPLYRQSAAH